jgi:hypothetical protein
MLITYGASVLGPAGTPVSASYSVAYESLQAISKAVSTQYESKLLPGAIQAACGNFLTPTATGQQTYDVGFQPQLILFWSTDSVTDCGTPNSGILTSPALTFAACDGTNLVRICAAVQDWTTGVSEAGNIFGTTLRQIRADGNGSFEASFVGVTSTGFTLDWTDVPSTIQWRVYWLALAGLTNVKVTSVYPPTSTGTQDIDVGFQPDFVLQFSTSDENNASEPHATWCIGAAVANSQFCVAGTVQHNVASPIAIREHLTDAIYRIYNGDGTLRRSASFVQFLPTGFRVNHTVVTTNQFEAIQNYLAVKGGQWAVGSSAKPTSAGPVNQDIAVSFTPRAAITLSGWLTATGSANDWTFSLGGAANASGQGSVAVQQRATLPDDVWCSTCSTKSLRKTNTSTVEAAAAASFQPSALRLTWDPNDAVASQIFYIIAGDSGGGTPISSSYIAVYEAIASIAAPRVSFHESISPVIVIRTVNLESLYRLSSVYAVPYESSAQLVGGRVVPIEAIGPIVSARVVPFESLRNITTNYSPQIESSLRLSSAFVVPYEALLAVQASRGVPLESIGSAIAVLVVPHEALGMVKSSLVSNFESTANVAVALLVPYESLQALFSSKAVPYESTGVVVVQAEYVVPYEALADVRAAMVVPYEGLTQVLGGGIISYEAAARVVREDTAAYESLQPAGNVVSASYEAIGRVVVVRTVPYEAVSISQPPPSEEGGATGWLIVVVPEPRKPVT